MATRRSKVELLRPCIGSVTFGIEPHEAPVSTFPVQPSRRDGLGALCREHWTVYTRALRQASRDRNRTVPAHEHTLAASLAGEGLPIEVQEGDAT